MKGKREGLGSVEKKGEEERRKVKWKEKIEKKWLEEGKKKWKGGEMLGFSSVKKKEKREKDREKINLIKEERETI